jgi:DNA-binding NtrC family response regulator
VSRVRLPVLRSFDGASLLDFSTALSAFKSSIGEASTLQLILLNTLIRQDVSWVDGRWRAAGATYELGVMKPYYCNEYSKALRFSISMEPVPDIPIEGREYHRCIQAILDVIRAMDSEGDLNEALRGSFENTAAGFGAQKALLLSVEQEPSDEAPKLKNVYAAGLSPTEISALEAGQSLRGISHSIIRDAIRSRELHVMAHPSFRRKAAATKAFTEKDDFSVLCAPILDPSRERVLAVMYFQNSGPDLTRAYRDADARLLRTYAEALHRVLHLYFNKEEARRQYEELLQGRDRPDDAPEIIGSSPATSALRRVIHETWIPSIESEEPAPILIRGETGTGKDLVARYLHAWSTRRSKPFVAVNAGEVSDNPDMARAHFHGHTRNAYTGALRDEPGAFRAAHGGVLFLDEIGELSEQGQLTLLRVLDNWRVTPLGDQRDYPVDVMVVLATNRNLDEAVANRRIKHDFLARFATQTIVLDPLRERPADIAPLLDHFLRDRERKAKKKTLGFTDEAMNALLSYAWPNNVRELREVCKLLVNHVKPGGRIDLRLLERAYLKVFVGERNSRGTQPATDLTLRAARARFERDLIGTRVERLNGNMPAVADSLGIDRSTLWRHMQRLGMPWSQGGEEL